MEADLNRGARTPDPLKALPDSNQAETLNRWRLILGDSAEESLSNTDAYDAEHFKYTEIDEILGYLYNREYGEEQGYRKEGGRGSSNLTVPNWLHKVRELFPKPTVEMLEKQALDRYGLTELLTDKKLLESLQPNMNLLKNIMQFKGRMKGDVLRSAKEIVRTVVEDLQRKLESQTRASIMGKRSRYTPSSIKSLRNLNFKRTITKNLKNVDRVNRRLVIDRLYFDGNIQPHNKWNVIIAVDESGSMMDSVIYSSVMASIFYRLNALRTHLFIFDTQVVDLSDRLDDPVDVLMSVQLGGGTHITKALRYGETLIDNPGKTIYILVSDLEEGYPIQQMYKACKDIMDAGCKLLVLTALDFNGDTVYNKHAAQTLTNMGAHVAAITPNELAEWIGEIIT
ncbi:VWA domain-containing protein [Paenibacillus illinoisensis]|uniref:VWA domain-containing protein n=1 Tax=Paenibacillus illinoisensis TaxID=59845 RepID=UPI002040D2FA|nr:VWA domain-containing protein [Paenibacillus illinoisensis]MCM3203309.1 VWA domain-containing protein [Paenibacillus illinoisensis]